MTIKLPQKIKSDFPGYNSLNYLLQQMSKNSENEVVLDFGKTTWFEANLAAVLGAIIEKAEKAGKRVELRNIAYNIENILSKNGFLNPFGYPQKIDSYNTTISYNKFSPEQGTLFQNCIKNELLNKPDFPSHSKALGKKINESIYELYENAQTHGRCDFIHTCGQHYPQKDRLDMTIVDMGDTIHENVENYLAKDIEAKRAIEWALKEGHTTKTGAISGGLGLNIMFEFIQLNKGKVQIISSNGYWEFNKGKNNLWTFNLPFPGTIVNIEFNLADKNNYSLKEEVSLDDLF